MTALRRKSPVLRVLPGGNAPKVASVCDEELVEGVQKGDERIADALYQRLYPVVDRTLCRVMGTRDRDHDDLVQVTFEQIVITLSRRTYQGNCSLATWPSAIAGRVGLKAIRSRTRERRVLSLRPPETELFAVGQTDPQSELDDRSELRRVQSCLARLSRHKAEAVLLHDVLGHDLQEVARMTNATVSATQSRLFRGRRELLRFLDEIGETRGGAES
jgi:RNA polymerase sigma-70 factor (ECF subfamily)